jgi:DNA invertase Pin-like site-specific DNA recombinase
VIAVLISGTHIAVRGLKANPAMVVAGREAARKNGTKFGRHRKVADAEHISAAKRMKTDGHTAKDIAKYLGVSRATLYRYLSKTALSESQITSSSGI